MTVGSSTDTILTGAMNHGLGKYPMYSLYSVGTLGSGVETFRPSIKERRVKIVNFNIDEMCIIAVPILQYLLLY
jgi:hypothetical protein